MRFFCVLVLVIIGWSLVAVAEDTPEYTAPATQVSDDGDWLVYVNPPSYTAENTAHARLAQPC